MKFKTSLIIEFDGACIENARINLKRIVKSIMNNNCVKNVYLEPDKYSIFDMDDTI
jgi:hypothetical protein